jgi:signal transduction histidine kinase/ActR/RegA family two-component response regulator
MPIPYPANDQERIAALEALGVLDTPPEPQFDELTRLAAQICDTPIALITLVDRDRQWFKSAVGLDATETPRENAFCAHAICVPEQDLFEITDATLDPRFADNPLVTGNPNIRFYAGAPLVTHDGWALGTLCVIDREPRQLDLKQKDALNILRRHVINSLELRTMIELQQKTISDLEMTRRELDKAKRTAEEATRVKAEFLAAMTHEIRTPMNAVIGMTTLLQASPLSDEQQESVRILRDSGELLLSIVNSVLDFSKIESGKLEIEQIPFDLPACIASSIDLVAERATAKGLRILTVRGAGAPDIVRGDPTRTRQILINLLSNAVKFTDAGSVTVAVDAHLLPTGNQELYFRVTDTGAGIPQDRLCRLFQQFSQTDVSTARRYGGTGLGLVISKRLAELQGGRMWAESTVGVGSSFHFTVSARPATPADSASVAKPVAITLDPQFAAQHPARILVAEDNPVNTRVIMRLLQKLGYQPTAVTNGLEAVRAVHQNPYDIVLMDVEMPEMDGPAAAAAIRRDLPADRQPAIVALTAHSLDARGGQFHEAGMNAYLGKPIRTAELTRILAAGGRPT